MRTLSYPSRSLPSAKSQYAKTVIFVHISSFNRRNANTATDMRKHTLTHIHRHNCIVIIATTFTIPTSPPLPPLQIRFHHVVHDQPQPSGCLRLHLGIQLMSAIIACERCFCILQPLRSQTVLRTSTTVVIIAIDYVVVLGLYSLVVSRYRLVCAYDPLTRSRIWTPVSGAFYLRHQALIDFLDGVMFGMAFPLVVIAIVTATTTITTVKLRQAAAWRAGTSSGGGLSAREIALTKMLIYNSVFFIICVFPITVFRSDVFNIIEK